jgi:hypothetical protein
MGLRVDNHRIVAVEPVPNHPVSLGKLCAKGWNTAFGIDPEQRITQPLKRLGHNCNGHCYLGSSLVCKEGTVLNLSRLHELSKLQLPSAVAWQHC